MSESLAPAAPSTPAPSEKTEVVNTSTLTPNEFSRQTTIEQMTPEQQEAEAQRQQEFEQELKRIPTDPFLEDLDSDQDSEASEDLKLSMYLMQIQNTSPHLSEEETKGLNSGGIKVGGGEGQGCEDGLDAIIPAATSEAVIQGSSSSPPEQNEKRTPNATQQPPAPSKSSIRAWFSNTWSSLKEVRWSWVPTTNNELFDAELKVLQCIQGLYVQRQIPTPMCDINTISFECRNPLYSDRHIVLLHGFGFGLAQWVPNWVHLASLGNVHAIDLPGFARSGRPKQFGKTADEAVLFFIHTIEEWMKMVIIDPFQRKQEKEKGAGGAKEAQASAPTEREVEEAESLAKTSETGQEEAGKKKPEIVLVGHSFGGYCAGKYASNYPHRLKSVVLVDAFGIKNKPQEAVDRFYKSASTSKKLQVWGAKKLFYSVNPLCLLRGAGPLGPAIMRKKKKRMSLTWKQFIGGDGSAVLDYLYHSNAQSPSGETLFSLLVSGLGAGIGEGWIVKLPLEQELSKLPEHLDLLFIHGENSWIPALGAQDITAFRKESMPAAKTETYLLPHAGHHVYADNCQGFNHIMESFLTRTAAATTGESGNGKNRE